MNDWRLRVARDADIPAIEKLIPLSVRGLQADYAKASQPISKVYTKMRCRR